MKHVKYNLYQNSNTVIPIETNFYKHNQEHFLFLFQMDDFSAMQQVGHVGLSETGVFVVGGEFSLSFSSSSKTFSAEPISKSSNAVGGKGVSVPGPKTVSKSS